MTSQTLFTFLPVFLMLLLAGLSIWILMRRFRRDLGLQKEEKTKMTDASFIIGAFHDVTKQLKEKEKELVRLKALAEQRAENIESYNENILQCVTSGVMTFDTQYKLTTINRAAEEILNLNRDKVLGKKCRDLFNQGSITEAVHRTLEWNAPSARMEAMLDSAGEHLWLGYNTAVLTDRHGEAIGVILSFSNLTEVKHLQEQIELRERLTALGEMSAGIAHELRNPMAVISGYLNLMSKKSDPIAQELLRKIADEINGMNRIIGDLLTFARPASLNRVPINVGEMIESCLTSVLQVRSAESRVTTELNLDTVTVSLDEVLMRQALTNLIQNAVEAMPDGGNLSIRCRAGIDLNVVIQDTGTGIPPDNIKKIFLPFFTTKDNGVGMGLALAHKIITSHGGRLEVESSEGRGTSFSVTLPKR
jgi:PAS domain S-box-containing protein